MSCVSNQEHPVSSGNLRLELIELLLGLGQLDGSHQPVVGGRFRREFGEGCLSLRLRRLDGFPDVLDVVNELLGDVAAGFEDFDLLVAG